MQSEALKPVEFSLGGKPFHALTAGEPGKPLLLFLHGFPEYSGAWEEILPQLADRYYCVAPDQRGYGKSWKPEGIESYKVSALVADAAAMIHHFAPEGRAAALIGHDWGASVAYALAIRLPELIDRLVILNSVHPAVFQQVLARGGAQTAASQYITWLRAEGSEQVLAAENFAKLFELFSAEMDLSWMTPERRAAYAEAWGGVEGLKAMIHWYRASRITVPAPGERLAEDPLAGIDPAELRITMPHLLIWGPEDTAFVPEVRDGLADYCDDLRVREIPGTDHWLAHQRPEAVVEAIRGFLEEG
ncbi:alpha/beta fold hydrolase [Acidimangrovimonas pyrenivorans]|uniref:Alpha/beta fold hydrolase n=1 Tax=Acidimangrovimonas pyrenivorans TaxID=2030798 RepID=A0ABV7ADZ7_9RHOB